MRNQHASALRSGVAAVIVVALIGCTSDRGPTTSAPNEAAAPTDPAWDSPVDWLLRGPGAEALGGVPGSTWTPQTPLEVAAACGPTDAHEGWTLSGTVVAAHDVADGFDAGDEFDRLPSNGQRSWEHIRDQQLRLVERADGRVDVALFVPKPDAPDWDAVDQVEIVFRPDRCG